MSNLLRKFRRAMSRGRVLLHDDGLFQVSVRRDARVRATALIEEDSNLPLWLLARAKAATYYCQLPDADEWQTFVALTTICTAAEAIANRFLEPLVDPAKWDGAGKKSIELKSAAKKWVLLSELLKTAPRFTLDSEPIQSFANVVSTRNDLVHFKHGKNVRHYEAEVTFKLGESLPSPDEFFNRGPSKVLREGIVEPTLNPSLAATYYAAFEKVLFPVLDQCAGTPLQDVAERARQWLARADAAIDAARNAPST